MYSKVKNKKIVLRMRAKNRDIFEAVKNGTKKVETRAATKKFISVKAGDSIVVRCGKDRFEKKVKRVQHFFSLDALFKKYRPHKITPWISSEKKQRALYYSFPGYREKIKRYGIIAMELE
ncbi:MAG: hypothetical protein HYW78_00090 [Parcubacteria group bacterium]|nr:hypothetical protein [Parcubacteria group bacterium]